MNNYLYHYGVKGMKWGVRKEYKPVGRRRSNSKAESKENSKKGLTDKQKRAIKIGATAAAATLAAYDGYKLYKSGKLDGFIKSGKSRVEKDGLKVNDLDIGVDGFKKLSNKESIEEAISKANSKHERNNCYNCVAATVGRLCGLDVTAKGDTQGGKGFSFDELCSAFKLNPDNETEVRRVMNPSVDKISNLIGRKYKEGDVGAIAVSWNDKYKIAAGMSTAESAAHTLNWTVKNGKVEFMDGQVNIRGDRLLNMLNAYLDNSKEVSIAKLANITDDPSTLTDILRRFVD